MANQRVAIIGGGIAGLTCATYLERSGKPLDLVLHEASDEVGGRVRTDRVDGFLLDRGFQIFLTAYPEARHLLDYGRLGLRSFIPGAKVHLSSGWTTVADPLREPSKVITTAFSQIATLKDKFALLELWKWCRSRTPEALLADTTGTTLDLLHRFGMSPQIIERFFRPFFGGVFLESKLETSAKLFAFTFRMFSDGDAALPTQGIDAIPRQLAEGLKRTKICLDSPAEAASLDADAVVVAHGEGAGVQWHGTSNWYFAAGASPMRDEPILALEAVPETGPINNVAVVSDVQPNYSPAGFSLVSAATVGIHEDEASVRAHLRKWFGNPVEDWRLLRAMHIRHALPAQPPDLLREVHKSVRQRGHYVCGDWCDTASLNGAMASGRRCAEAILHDLFGEDQPDGDAKDATMHAPPA